MEKLEFSGSTSEGDTPVPISNTEVKPLGVDGTALATGWESRTLPGVKIYPARRRDKFLVDGSQLIVDSIVGQVPCAPDK